MSGRDAKVLVPAAALRHGIARGCAALWLVLAGVTTPWTILVIALQLPQMAHITVIGMGEGPEHQPTLGGVPVAATLALATLVPIALVSVVGGIRLLRGGPNRLAVTGIAAWIMVGAVVWVVGGTPDILVFSVAIFVLLAYGGSRRDSGSRLRGPASPEW